MKQRKEKWDVKWVVGLILLVSLVLTACGNGNSASNSKGSNSSNSNTSETKVETPSSASPSETRDITIRIGYQKYGTINILKADGSLDKRLADERNIKIEWTEFPGGPQLLEALNVGSIDIGHTGEAPPIFAQAAGAPLVYLAHEPASPKSEGIIVPKDSPIQSVADLKGKTIVLNKGSNVHYLLVKQLEKHGVSYKDVTVKYLPPADGRAAFEKGSADAWVIWDPFLAAAETATGGRVLADGEGVVSNHEFYLATREFAEKYPDLVNILLEEADKIDAWSKEHPQELAEKLSPQLGIDVESLVLAAERRNYGVQSIDAELIKAQQAIADTFLDLELIPKKLDINDAILK
ncbi:sulfonate transport system substrate-binding protein [Fontibacillus panacisegetis]|uniref:Putative aliphatic sulfonates-binding protein n=1 Tax=Fontibacillus panacisegetis TaxID=670482 RepID=A0A1G7V089_9BACL|nr:sulfonate ABC transporter substrate-binding protein [Fontibacillus panacisegetis]SDG53285.1 sulfonate transport system substrate-binding protein [Fontibacillus panacisegetis]